MLKRTLSTLIGQICFETHKMAFVSGPRQCGKTTLAKLMLEERKSGHYYNWDAHEFRKVWVKTPQSIIEGSEKLKTGITPLYVLDEIHKAKLWKRTLKGIYDSLVVLVDIIVTGSARLNVYKKGSDSLLGRYYHFRMHPLTVREMSSLSDVPPENFIDRLFSRAQTFKKEYRKNFESLDRFGGFPEPLLAQNEKQSRLWRASRVEKVIREDLRDLSRIPELSQIEMLVALLPDKVGSLFSIASLQTDLEVSFQTVKRWVEYLKELYYIFEIKPYHSFISRSLKKEGKIYFWDYSEISNPAARFENLVASHLLKTCHYWTDGGEGNFELFFLRDKEKREIDFLITKDRKPWLPVEAKLGDHEPSPHWRKFLREIPCQKALQIIHEPGHWRIHPAENKQILVASANEALSYFI